MALNGSVSVDVTPNSHDILTFSWEATQDKQSRTSTVVWKMELISDASGALNVTDADAYSWTVIIDGQEFSGKSNIHIGANETKTLTSGEVTLTHEADGTKVFEFTFTQNFGGISWGGSTELCPVCSGTGLDINQSGGISIPCSACNGNGVIGSSSGAIIINDVTGSGVGELDSLIGKYPILDLINGLIMHLCSRPTYFPKREPVAFLYGHVAKEGETPTHTINGVGYVGVVAPDIYSAYTPELQETHPYAVMTSAMFGAQYGLKVYSEPVVDGVGYGKCRQAICDSASTAWGDFANETDYGKDGIMVSGIVWTNHDICYDDGTVYMSATDPIPIYK